MSPSSTILTKQMSNFDDRMKCFAVLAVFLGIAFVSSPVFAASAGMPWEGPLSSLLDSFTGPVAKVLGAVAIIVLGIGIAFSEGGSGMRKGLYVVMGLAIAFNAVSWGIGFLGFGGGLAL